ncbi:MAG: pyridoxal-phosphate-dependent aminotransferase family protein [Candidatus Hermodarchaeota archaeon]
MRKRPLMMVPGPVDCSSKVLKALSEQPLYPRNPQFIASFRRVLQGLREVFGASDGQPVLMNGSGLLAMEMACANFMEQDTHVVILNSGFFGDQLLRVAKCYSKNITVLEAQFGERVALDRVRKHLDSSECQVLAVSHIDTESSVKADLKDLATIAQEKGVLTIVDAVASVGGEWIEQTRWGVDVCFASTQKALACPPGLALLMLSPRALQHLKNRKTPPSTVYQNLKLWIDSMQSYETNGVPRLVSTQATNLIAALDVALELIRKEGLEQRIQRHEQIAQCIREGVTEMGLELVPKRPEYYANTVTTMYSPNQLLASSVIEQMLKNNVRIAPGLGPRREELLRIGHMGITTLTDATTTLVALKRVLKELLQNEML